MSVSSRFVCGACRYATRRAATSVASPNGFSSRAFGPANGASRAAFSTSTSRRKEKDDPTNTDPEIAFLDTKNPVEPEVLAKEPIATTSDGVDPTPTDPASTSPAANAAAAIPWYLRHTQDEASHSSQAVQKAHIPDLPTNPPPILPALLEYLAITAGLDDLSLLDLRSLDPPPALGPKLIMLIATARSERHLHVSADRFARWLRREHGLKANAAGLLGRNELKIKLRRKAKRMRMLANVGGALPDGNIDDGIRTGWICCTLSRVEAHPDDTHMPGDDVKEFIGFRDVKPGVNIVVQMFTEEKRAETDLETLWGGVLRTKKREERNADEVLRGLEQDLEDLESEEREEKERNVRDAGEGAVAPEKPAAPLHQFRRPKASAGDVFPGADEVPSAKQMRGQMRRLHTVGLGR